LISSCKEIFLSFVYPVIDDHPFWYLSDMQMLATETVLKQAELIADEITKGK